MPKPIRTFLIWLASDVPYVPFRPYVFGLAIGRMPHRVEPSAEADDKDFGG